MQVVYPRGYPGNPKSTQILFPHPVVGRVHTRDALEGARGARRMLIQEREKLHRSDSELSDGNY